MNAMKYHHMEKPSLPDSDHHLILIPSLSCFCKNQSNSKEHKISQWDPENPVLLLERSDPKNPPERFNQLRQPLIKPFVEFPQILAPKELLAGQHPFCRLGAKSSTHAVKFCYSPILAGVFLMEKTHHSITIGIDIGL